MISKPIIEAFQHFDYCHVPQNISGSCDAISIEFLRYVKEKCGLDGIVIDVSTPNIEPTLGYKYFGGREQIHHYLCFFPELGLAYDWTARQFWDDTQVPQVMTIPEVNALWDDVIWDDARPELEEMFNYDC